MRLASKAMSTEPPDDLRLTFQQQLNLALTRGRATSPYSGLGPGTSAAIDSVAYNHPDADADSIAAAYDAFDCEHGDA